MLELTFKNSMKMIMVLSLMFVLLVSGLGSSNASAQSTATNVNPLSTFEASVKDFEETTSSVDSEVTSELLTETKGQLEETLKSLSLDDLNYENVKVVKLQDDKFFVQYHVKSGSTYEGISGVSFILDENYKVISTTELQAKLVNEENASLQVWTDGKKSIDQNLEKPDVQPQWSWSVLKKCLVNEMGVSWVVVGTISVVCAGACVGTGGIACAPCIYTAASVTGGNWGWCIGKAGAA